MSNDTINPRLIELGRIQVRRSLNEAELAELSELVGLKPRDPNAFSFRLRRWREANGLTIEQAAQRLSCSKGAMRSWLYGDREPRGPARLHVESIIGYHPDHYSCSVCGGGLTGVSHDKASGYKATGFCARCDKETIAVRGSETMNKERQ